MEQTTRRQRWGRHGLIALSLVFWVGCGSDDAKKKDELKGQSVTYGELWKNVLKPSCGNALCHRNGVDPTGGPDFSTAVTFYQGSVNVRAGTYSGEFAVNMSAACRKLKLVDPGSPQTSMIMGVIRDETILGCTPSFSNHYARGLNLSAKSIAQVETWIAAGAKP